MLISKSKGILILALTFAVLFITIGGYFLLIKDNINDSSNTEEFVEYPVKLGEIEYDSDEYLESFKDPVERYSKYIQASHVASFNGDFSKALDYNLKAYEIEEVDKSKREFDLFNLYSAAKVSDQNTANKIVEVLGENNIDRIQSSLEYLEEFNN